MNGETGLGRQAGLPGVGSETAGPGRVTLCGGSHRDHPDGTGRPSDRTRATTGYLYDFREPVVARRKAVA